MYIKYKMSNFIYDFVPVKICTCTKVYYSLIQKCTADIGHRINLTNRYIDGVFSINNPEFEHYLVQMYLAELEIKDTTESITSASYLDLLLSIGRDGQLLTSI